MSTDALDAQMQMRSSTTLQVYVVQMTVAASTPAGTRSEHGSDPQRPVNCDVADNVTTSVPKANQMTITSSTPVTAQSNTATEAVLGVFERYLFVWVLLTMLLGILIGATAPSVADGLGKAAVGDVSIPLAILLWLMIFPMLLRVDFPAVKYVVLHPKGVLLTSLVNFAIQPFFVFGGSWLFFKVFYTNALPVREANDYLAGSVLLASAPCTAMVFVWSRLCNGDPGYTLVQVAVNDLTMLATYVPTVVLLLGLSDVSMPWTTVIYSVLAYVAVPLLIAASVRVFTIQRYGEAWFMRYVVNPLERITAPALVATVLLIFIYQGEKIAEQPTHVLLILVPMTLHSYVIWAVTLTGAYWLKLPFRIAGPASMIATSSFFELAVAVALSVYGPDSPVTLAAVVGVLMEVPVMLSLVQGVKRFKPYFDQFESNV